MWRANYVLVSMRKLRSGLQVLMSVVRSRRPAAGVHRHPCTPTGASPLDPKNPLTCLMSRLHALADAHIHGKPQARQFQRRPLAKAKLGAGGRAPAKQCDQKRQNSPLTVLLLLGYTQPSLIVRNDTNSMMRLNKS